MGSMYRRAIFKFKVKFFSNKSSLIALITLDNDMLFWHIIVIIILVFFLYFLFKHNTQIRALYSSTEYYLIVLTVLPLVCITWVAFVLPTFSFIFLLTITCLLSFTTFPFRLFKVTQSLVTFQQDFLLNFLNLLCKTGFLDLFAIIYIKYFYVDRTLFRKRSYLLLIFSLLGILFSRWYFIQISILHNSFSFMELFEIYLLLFCNLGLLYFRVSLLFARFLVFNSLRLNTNLLSQDILFVLGENDPLPSKETDSPQTSSSQKRRFSLINVNFTRVHNNHHHAAYNNNFYNRLGLCIALGSCIFAAGSVLYARESINQARIQNEHSRVQNTQFDRQNDLEEVSQGIRSKESYIEKWGQSPSSSTSQKTDFSVESPAVNAVKNKS